MVVSVYFGLLISLTLDFKAEVTFADILLEVDSHHTLYSVRLFLVLLFFGFLHKIGLFVMLIKRGLFDFLLEWKYRGISEERFNRSILNESDGSDPIIFKNSRTYEEEHPGLYKICGVIVFVILSSLSVVLNYAEGSLILPVI